MQVSKVLGTIAVITALLAVSADAVPFDIPGMNEGPLKFQEYLNKFVETFKGGSSGYVQSSTPGDNGGIIQSTTASGFTVVDQSTSAKPDNYR